MLMQFRVSKICIIGKHLPCQRIYATIKSVCSDRIHKVLLFMIYATVQYSFSETFYRKCKLYLIRKYIWIKNISGVKQCRPLKSWWDLFVLSLELKLAQGIEF